MAQRCPRALVAQSFAFPASYGVAQAQATNAQRQQTSSSMMNMGMPGGIGTSIAGGAQGAGGASQGYMYL